MADNDEGSDGPLTLDDVRIVWIWICLIPGLLGLMAFAIRFAFFPDFEPPGSVNDGWRWWGDWLKTAGILLIHGAFFTAGIFNLREFWESMRFTDRFAMLTAITGIVMMTWNAVIRDHFRESDLLIPPPTSSVLMTIAACLLLYQRKNLLDSSAK